MCKYQSYAVRFAAKEAVYKALSPGEDGFTSWQDVEVKRLENPHEYYVDLSKELWTLKNNMLNNIYF